MTAVVPGWPTSRYGQDRLALKVVCPQCKMPPRFSCAHHASGRPCGTHAARRHAAKDAVAAGTLDPSC